MHTQSLILSPLGPILIGTSYSSFGVTSTTHVLIINMRRSFSARVDGTGMPIYTQSIKRVARIARKSLRALVSDAEGRLAAVRLLTPGRRPGIICEMGGFCRRLPARSQVGPKSARFGICRFESSSAKAATTATATAAENNGNNTSSNSNSSSKTQQQ